ncbi:Helicase [Zea mays]|uniref:Helicase n=1 Tax=Zea mays TaxID=4577 RepID=A0A1D6G6R2_MAIZE|nr:Helicase [Zea mays]
MKTSTYLSLGSNQCICYVYDFSLLPPLPNWLIICVHQKYHE